MSIRTLPIRVPPLPGEAIDSWIEALAARHHASWADVLDALGLTQPRSTVTGWNARLTPHEMTVLAAATASDPAEIAAATLDRFDGTALRINSTTRKLDPFPWGPVSSSRFCPECLAESGGRWQLRWRLAWSFTCVRHHRLLADTCPACRHRQRRLPLPGLAIPAPGRCASPLPGSVGIAPARCGADLTTAETRHLVDDHPALNAQRRIDDVVDTGTATFGVYAAAPLPGETALADLKIVADRILTYATTASLAEVVPPDLLTAYTKVSDRADTHRPGKALPAAASVAVAVTAGLAALDVPDAHRGGDALRWLINDTRDYRGKTNSTTKTNASTLRRNGASPALEAIQLSALADSMNPTDQLRHRITDPFPRRPLCQPDRIDALARSLPTMLWPSWSLRLALPRPQQRQLRPALSLALMLTGTTTPITDAADMLGGHTDSYRLTRALNLLTNSGHWDDVRHALTSMSDHLAHTGTPIDYRRRRSLDYTDLFPDDHWRLICRENGAVSLNLGTAKRVRCWLFERISGLPADTSPAAIDDDHHFHTRTANFVRHLTPELAADLDSHALEFLAAQGINGEPPRWQPPAQLLHGLSLPGPDPADIDIGRLHHLIRHDDRDLGEAAEHLGTTLDVVRHLLEIHPAPSTTTPGAPTTAYLAVKAALPPDRLADLYLRQRLGIAAIAEKFGTHDKVINRLARDYQIPIRRPGNLSTIDIDTAWFHHQHITCGRSLTDLARETGTTWHGLVLWAQRHNLPLRRSHFYHDRHNPLTDDQIDTAPTLLQPTLRRTSGTRHLNVFATASAHPTLGDAADHLSIHNATLAKYIRRIEHGLQGELLTPRTRSRRTSMTLSPLGQAVLDAITTMESTIEPRHN